MCNKMSNHNTMTVRPFMWCNMGSVLTSIIVDRGFHLQSCQSTDCKIGIGWTEDHLCG